MYNEEQNDRMTLSVPELLRTSDPTNQQLEVAVISSQQSPDSSMNEISVETSESLTPSVPASSESLLALTRSQPVVNSNSISNKSSEDQQDSDLPPAPRNPLLLAQYHQIISRPGPKSLKRKRILELENKIPSDLSQSLSQSTPEQDDGFIFQKLIQRVQSKGSKRHRKSASKSMSVSSSSSLSSHRLQIDLDDSQRAVQPSGPQHMSPQSSQMTQKSPSPGPFRPPLRLPSSSLSSNEERIEESSTVRRPGPKSRQPVRTQPVFKPPPPPQRRTDDGNAHSNSGAPRRINIPAPTTGPSGRDPRITSTKVISGG
jgi:hypothetical protein